MVGRASREARSSESFKRRMQRYSSWSARQRLVSCRAFGSLANEWLTPKDRFDSGEQVTRRICLMNAARCTQAKGFAYQIGRGFLAEEQKSCLRCKGS